MAVPSSPSIGSRALYYGYVVPAPVRTVNPLTPNQVDFVPSTLPGDINGPGGSALPAIVASVSGASPDYQGTVFLVHLPNGTIVPRYTGFQSNQPLLNSASWVTAGSNPAQARWSLMDALA